MSSFLAKISIYFIIYRVLWAFWQTLWYIWKLAKLSLPHLFTDLGTSSVNFSIENSGIHYCLKGNHSKLPPHVPCQRHMTACLEFVKRHQMDSHVMRKKILWSEQTKIKFFGKYAKDIWRLTRDFFTPGQFLPYGEAWCKNWEFCQDWWKDDGS